MCCSSARAAQHRHLRQLARAPSTWQPVWKKPQRRHGPCAPLAARPMVGCCRLNLLQPPAERGPSRPGSGGSHCEPPLAAAIARAGSSRGHVRLASLKACSPGSFALSRTAPAALVVGTSGPGGGTRMNHLDAVSYSFSAQLTGRNLRRARN